MKTIKHSWQSDGADHAFEMVFVQGTAGRPFRFGEGKETPAIKVPSFFIATVPVTQACWTHIVGAGRNPSVRRGDRRPVENVSWDEVTGPDGFLFFFEPNRPVMRSTF